MVKRANCDFADRVRIPATPESFCRLTDKPSGYEPLITRSNRVRKTYTDMVELAYTKALEPLQFSVRLRVSVHPN